MGRNINHGEGGVRFLSLLIKIVIVAVIIYVAYHIAEKNDVFDKLKSKSEKTIEQITDFSFKDIDHINTENGENVSVDDFLEKYKDKKYKIKTDMKKLSEDGDIMYYVYNKNGNYEYKLFDLGNGYIKVVKDSAALYKEVK